MDDCAIHNHIFFFFFQAEDGIRDADVTGVQTCALPILPLSAVFNSVTLTPERAAKPSAALVGLPSASKAIFAGGPYKISSLSACWLCSSLIRTARRRGAAKLSTLAKLNPESLRPCSIPLVKAWDKLFNALGGNSSVPSSTKKLLVTMLIISSPGLFLQVSLFGLGNVPKYLFY